MQFNTLLLAGALACATAAAPLPSFSLKDLLHLAKPQVEVALENPAIPGEVKEKLDTILKQVEGLIPLLPAVPLTKRTSRLAKPADFDDPNFARVVIDDWNNEIYRQVKVERFKANNPSMQLTQAEYDEVTSELSFLAISVPEEEYCTKVGHEIDSFEFHVKPETLQAMCSTQRNALLAIHDEEERLYAAKDAAVKAGNLKSAKDLAHRIADLLKKEQEHAKHGAIERTRWIDKQVQRAKHEAAVLKGEKKEIY